MPAMTDNERREALDLLKATNLEMAKRAEPPRWYHITLGLLVGGLVAVFEAPVIWRIAYLIVYVVGLVLLMRAYRKHTGMWIPGYRAGRTRWVAYGTAAFAVAILLITDWAHGQGVQRAFLAGGRGGSRCHHGDGLRLALGLSARPGRGLMPAALDPTIHAALRLQICATLAAAETVDFATVREMLDVSESVLSKHVKVLEEAGYVVIRKATSEARRRTWLALTSAGRKAFAAHAAALRSLVG